MIERHPARLHADAGRLLRHDGHRRRRRRRSGAARREGPAAERRPGPAVDSLAAVAGGAASCSSNTCYIESAAGVGDGARTGLANLVTGGCSSWPSSSPRSSTIVPYEAASPALVVVGFLLMTQVKYIPGTTTRSPSRRSSRSSSCRSRTRSPTASAPASSPTSSSRRSQGKGREVHWLLWVVAALLPRLLRHRADRASPGRRLTAAAGRSARVAGRLRWHREPQHGRHHMAGERGVGVDVLDPAAGVDHRAPPSRR